MTYDTVEKCHQRADTKRVLAYVNRLRLRLGLKPVKFLTAGSLGSPTECSIAATLTTKYTRADVTGTSILVNRRSRVSGNRVGDIVQTFTETPPIYVREWIKAFDQGDLPGLRKTKALAMTE